MPDTLREQQYAFARHLRDPANHPAPPGLEDRRLAIYRRLFRRSVEGLLAGSFPVLRQTLGDDAWHALVGEFYAGHRSATPQFTRVAGTFAAWTQDRASPPWLGELAHYEWVEIDLQLSAAIVPAHDPHGDVYDGVPRLSPLALPLGYRWPVMSIGPGCLPDTPPAMPTLVLVYRDATHAVRFAQLAPFAYRLLVSIGANDWTGRRHLDALAAEAGGNGATLHAEGRALLERLRADGIVHAAPQAR